MTYEDMKIASEIELEKINKEKVKELVNRIKKKDELVYKTLKAK
jgi:hypothetical protein